VYVYVCLSICTQSLSVEHGLPWEELAAAAKLVHVTLGSVLNTSARRSAPTAESLVTSSSETGTAVTALSEGSLARVLLQAVPAVQEVAALWQCGAGALDELFVLVQPPSLGVTETAVGSNSSNSGALQRQLQAVQVCSACLKHMLLHY
jgi:hypothetical protein